MTVAADATGGALMRRGQVQPGVQGERLVPADSYDDGRLFKELLLYAEGLHKPLLRGYLHLLAACVVPFFTAYLLLRVDGIMPRLAVLLYFVGKMWCFGASGLYHVFRWHPRVEILLHKLDHCGIFAMTAGALATLTTRCSSARNHRLTLRCPLRRLLQSRCAAAPLLRLEPVLAARRLADLRLRMLVHLPVGRHST